MTDSLPALRLPLKLSLYGEGVMIHDAAERSVCCIWFDDGCAVRRSVRRRFTKEEAIAVGKAVARALTRLAEGG